MNGFFGSNGPVARSKVAAELKQNNKKMFVCVAARLNIISSWRANAKNGAVKMFMHLMRMAIVDADQTTGAESFIAYYCYFMN